MSKQETISNKTLIKRLLRAYLENNHQVTQAYEDTIEDYRSNKEVRDRVTFLHHYLLHFKGYDKLEIELSQLIDTTAITYSLDNSQAPQPLEFKPHR